MKKLIRYCFITLLVALVSKNAAAVGNTYTWTGSSNTNWNNSNNWSPSTGFPSAGDFAIIPATATMPTVNVTSFCATLTINGSTTITLSATLIVNNGLTVNNTSTLTFAGSGSSTIGGASNLTYNTSLVIGGFSSITFPASSSLILSGNNLNTITNNGALQFTGSTLTMPYQTTFTNNGSCSITSTTVNVSGNNSTIANTNSFTAASSTINLNGQQAAITNTGSSAVFKLSASTLNMPIANNQINITNSSGATFTANNNSAINIGSYQGYIKNSAIFMAGTSASACTITLTGQGNSSSPYSITNTGTFTLGSTSVINANGTDASNPIKVNNVSGTFTLQSDTNGSAAIGPLGAGSSFIGTFNVERFVTGGTLAHRGYRLLSSPVYASKIGSNKVYSINYLKNSIYLTATTTSGGFDNTTAANPTLYLYRENLTPQYTTFLNSNFIGISNINSPPTYLMNDAAYPSENIPVGNGYLCFFRGNRANAAFGAETVTSYVPQSVTLTATGTLNQGPIVVADWFTPATPALSYTAASPSAVKGYNLVGNPYASSIDWETFQTAAPGTGIYGKTIGTSIYVLDPVSKNYGAYVKGGGGLGTNNATNVIASGQGFFIVAGDTTARLVFSETAKTPSQVTGLNLLMDTKPIAYANNQYLGLKLAKDSINTDDILIRFNNNASTAYVQDMDAPYKQGSGAVSLSSLSSDHIPLAINMQPLPKKSETIGLTVNVTADGIYSLNMKNLVGVPQLFDIWLMDTYKNDSLDMRQNKTYRFNVLKSDTNTFGSKRFALVIRQNQAYAYRLLNFTAAKVASTPVWAPQVQMVWKTENEQNYTNFTVERSTDNGKVFSVIGSVASSGLGTYSFIDKDPVQGQNLYRLKQEDINNAITLSNMVPVLYADLSSNRNVSIYPNPVNSMLYLAINSKSTGTEGYQITITGTSGILVKQATTAQPYWQNTVADLLPGTYLVRVTSNKDKSVVGDTKFVKM